MSDKDVFEAIKFYKLRRCSAFDRLSAKAFAKIYNGYGPDAWPSSMRAVLTWIFDNFKEVAGVHDVEYFLSDGTRSGFKKTVEHWKQNSSIMLGVKYPMTSPTLWIHRSVAWGKLYLARKAISGKAAYKFYVEAYKKACPKPVRPTAPAPFEGLLTENSSDKVS
jgi:hypothetical protein